MIVDFQVDTTATLWTAVGVILDVLQTALFRFLQLRNVLTLRMQTGKSLESDRERERDNKLETLK